MTTTKGGREGGNNNTERRNRETGAFLPPFPFPLDKQGQNKEVSVENDPTLPSQKIPRRKEGNVTRAPFLYIHWENDSAIIESRFLVAGGGGSGVSLS